MQHQHRQAFNTRSAAACFAADAAVVLLFVTIGRFSHDEPLSASGLAQTGWPFAVGLLGGYVVVVFARWPAVSLGGGLLVSIKMLVLGALLRAGVANEPTPFAFVLVAAVFLIGGATLWRFLALRRLNGYWPRDARTGIVGRSRFASLRSGLRSGLRSRRRRTGIFTR